MPPASRDRLPSQRPRVPGRFGIIAIAGTVFFLVVILPPLVNLGASWLWFREIGFQSVLASELITRGLFLAGVAGASFGVLWLNVRLAQRRARPLATVVGDMIALPQSLPAVLVRRLATAAAAFLAVCIALPVSAGWLTVLQFLNRVPFGERDAVFGRDIGFYVYVLPILSGVLAVLIALTVFSLLLAAGVYLLHGAVALVPPRLHVSREASVHFAVLLVVFFVLSAAGTWMLSIPGLLFSGTGPFTGASYTDVNARLPGLHVSAVAALVAAALVIVGVVRGRVTTFAVAAGAVYIGTSVLVRALVPAAVQKLVVAPTELTRERPFIAHHIDATRRAWGIDSVQTRDVRGEGLLTLASVRANTPTIENVRLWDREPLRQTFGQIQEIRTYYDFVSIDDDRYRIDGRYRQVHLSPRELNSASLPTRSFINEHLTFTHGMGVTLAPVNQVTPEGLPVLFIKDLPPASTVSLRLTRPQIYYGELTTSYAVVGTRQKEFDSPSGDANIFANYEGSGGVALSSLGRRLLLAWHFRSLKLLLSGDITSESRILYGREIGHRAQTALPFLRFDGDPYMVISDSGRLYWLLDGYTTTRRYPYAQPLPDGTTYMRNSVKVVIDAYHGSVRAFVADSADPLIRTFGNVFPGILEPLDRMPADLRAHLRYPEDLFRVQAALYTTYHMTQPDEFYHREDQWQVPVLRQGETESAFMRRIVMRLPDEQNAEFIFMSPFTPRQKDNLAAWMVARNDGAQYGKLLEYRFPKQSLVFGPTQIVNRMNQDPDIAREITLWQRPGSEVIRGALMVIPIEASLIYVQPLYLRAEGGRIPELKRVIVAHQNRVVMDGTFEGALARLFGGEAIPPPVQVAGAPAAPATEAAGEVTAAPNAATADLIARARQHYDRAIEAQRAGNWAVYGTEIERLGAVLRQLGTAGTTRRP